MIDSCMIGLRESHNKVSLVLGKMINGHSAGHQHAGAEHGGQVVQQVGIFLEEIGDSQFHDRLKVSCTTAWDSIPIRFIEKRRAKHHHNTQHNTQQRTSFWWHPYVNS